MATTTTRPGDRVRLVHTADAYTRLRPGAQGTVTHVGPFGRFHECDDDEIQVRWDDGSRLSLIPRTGDRWEVIR